MSDPITIRAQHHDDGLASGQPVKLKGHRRLAQRLQRMSSTQSFTVGRLRASSSPSRGSNLSSVNLANSGVTLPRNSSQDDVTSSSATRSIPVSPSLESPYVDGFQSRLMNRRAALGQTIRSRSSTMRSAVTPSTSTQSLSQASIGLQESDSLNFEEDYFTRPIVQDRLDGQRTPYTPPIPRTPTPPRQRADFRLFDELPHEVVVAIFRLLSPKELIRTSRVSKQFKSFCYDGQLWSSIDASEFYRDIPAESLTQIIRGAGPFVKHLNLRGCVQVEHCQRADIVVEACKNLVTATLEGCRNFKRQTLHKLLEGNDRLAHVNLTGLVAVNNHTCKVIARNCPQLETLNVSWCTHMDARGIKTVLAACPKLRDLRASEVRGFASTEIAEMIFKAEKLERLILSGCTDIDDDSLRIMMQGVDPEIDILEDRAIVPPRKLRHLDISRNPLLSDRGLNALAYNVPDLEGLQVSGLSLLTDDAFIDLFPTIPHLTHLDLEEVTLLTNAFLSEHLAKAPFAPKLQHLSVSYCELLGDAGILPVIRTCRKLQSIDLDNTRISDLALLEAADMIRARSAQTSSSKYPSRPTITLTMIVFDCPNITWTGIREVLSRNAEIKPYSEVGGAGKPGYPTELIALKCFYGFQQTVEAHTNRLLAGQYDAASKLERAWGEWMIAQEEMGAGGAGSRRRRRRARQAANVHADEEAGFGGTRRRARTGPCLVM